MIVLILHLTVPTAEAILVTCRMVLSSTYDTVFFVSFHILHLLVFTSKAMKTNRKILILHLRDTDEILICFELVSVILSFSK